MDEKRYAFLGGAGEMGQLTRSFDWSKTSLGSPDLWPQSLRTIVCVILNSRFPMFLWWGADLIQFYNDAYRPSLGNDGKHPAALGQKGADSWKEIWSLIKPMIDNVMAGGCATWNENQLIPIFRNGRLEDVYWTFSYSPVPDETGKPGGVLVTCQETTATVAQTSVLRQSKQQLNNLFMQINAGIAQTDTTGHLVEVNDRYCQMLGYSREELLGTSLRNLNHPDDDPAHMELFKKCVEEGVNFIINKRSIRKDGSVIWVNNSVSLIVEPNGRKLVTAVSIDISAAKKQEQLLQESEAKLRAIIDAAPAGIGLFEGRDLIIKYPNQTFIDIVGKGPAVEGLPLREAMPELITEGQACLKILDDVFTTGVPFVSPASLVKIVQNGVLTDNYYNISYTPLRNGAGEVYAILDIAIDVTEQVTARHRITESEARFRTLAEQAPMFVFESDVDATVAYWNLLWLDFVGQTAEEATGRDGWPKVVHPDDYKRLLDIYISATAAKKSYEAEVRVRRKDGRYRNVLFTGKPHYKSDGTFNGYVGSGIDISAQVENQLAIAESEAKMRAIIENARAAIGVYVGRDMVIENPNQVFIDILGKGPGIVGKPLREALPELEMENQHLLKTLDDVFTTGIPHNTAGTQVKSLHNGEIITGYYNFSYTPVFDKDGKTYEIVVVAIDVTEQVLAGHALEEKETALRNAIELAQLGTWTLDIATGATHLSQKHADMFGLDRLYLPYEQALAIVHPDDRSRVQTAFEQAMKFSSGGKYEAEYRIINASNGNHQLIHAQGEATFDAAGRPVRIAGTAQDITVQHKLQTELENRVELRTKELAAAVQELEAANEELARSNEQLIRSNEDLAQYAYVASHDLQEPLRKIRIFAGILGSSKDLPAESRVSVEKIGSSAERMTLLIQDLLSFSRLMNSDTLMLPVSLSETVKAVCADFELITAEKEATIEIGPLPEIQAVNLQMNQLFYNLIGNALKFSWQGGQPRIVISARPIPQEEVRRYLSKPLTFSNYYHITVSDNGIGFEMHYNEQIFEVFKRLHAREVYPGSGIGLALCRRIVANHHGHIYAVSEKGLGSTFHIILPEKQQDAVAVLQTDFSQK